MTTRPAGIRPVWILGAAGFVILACAAALLIGPISIDRMGIVREVLDAALPFSIDSGLSDQQQAIVRNIRLPRVVLGLLVGCLLYTSPSPRDQRGSRMPSSA